MTEQQKQAVAAEVSRRENITAIVWLVIGIVQVLTCAGIIAGAALIGIGDILVRVFVLG